MEYFSLISRHNCLALHMIPKKQTHITEEVSHLFAYTWLSTNSMELNVQCDVEITRI